MQEVTNGQESQFDEIGFLLDEKLNEEGTGLRPLTKGLGFHHEEKPQRVGHSAVATPSSSASSVLPKKVVTRSTSSNQYNVNSMEESVKTAGLENFYSTSVKKSNETMAQPSLKTRSVDKVKVYHQALAWVTDMLIVVLTVTALLMSFLFVAQIPYSQAMRVGNDIYIISTVLFCISYLAYFSILELGQTPGKLIFSIKVSRTSDADALTIWNTSTRSLVSLSSFVLLGLPLLIDFQGKLSDTKLIKR